MRQNRFDPNLDPGLFFPTARSTSYRRQNKSEKKLFKQPSDKTQVQKKLEKKIVVLREWAQAGVPKEWRKRLRFSIRWIAEWSDLSLGVEAVGSPNMVSKNGPYRDLVIEAQELLKLLHKTSRAYQTKSEENVLLKAKVRNLERDNKKDQTTGILSAINELKRKPPMHLRKQPLPGPKRKVRDCVSN